jgi:hypothetical protein
LKESSREVAERMNRQFKRGVEREWNRIQLGACCTRFVEYNNLFIIPYVVYFQAVKVGDDLLCVHSVGLFEFREGSGFIEHVTVCQLFNGLFRDLGFVELGFVPEEAMQDNEEIEF